MTAKPPPQQKRKTTATTLTVAHDLKPLRDLALARATEYLRRRGATKSLQVRLIVAILKLTDDAFDPATLADLPAQLATAVASLYGIDLEPTFGNERQPTHFTGPPMGPEQPQQASTATSAQT